MSKKTLHGIMGKIKHRNTMMQKSEQIIFVYSVINGSQIFGWE